MASIILCDNTEAHYAQDEPTRADKLVTDLNTGDVTAFCDPDFMLLCVAVARQAEAQAPEQPTEPVTATGDDDDEDDDEDAIARLRGEGAHDYLANEPSPDGITRAVVTTAGGHPASVTPATVVKRGTSPSRRHFEGKKRAKAAEQAAEQPSA